MVFPSLFHVACESEWPNHEILVLLLNRAAKRFHDVHHEGQPYVLSLNPLRFDESKEEEQICLVLISSVFLLAVLQMEEDFLGV